MDTGAETKRRLAGIVAGMISDGDSVFLDVGSTTAYVALALRGHSNLFVVTNSAFVAHTLATRNNNRLFMAGGELRPHDGGAFGAEALDMLGRFNTQIAVFSIGAINGRNGFMLHDLAEANIAGTVAAHSQIRIVVSTGDKFGRRAPIVLGHSADIDILVTDRQPPPDLAAYLERNGTEVLLARAGDG